ncbi:unnamed protein product [Cylicostephanus goldi]|uniref:Uncharacterized protein n=1 Tax=Cylicostephanus goldi TaxID=71465 RepID=A0A3P6SZA6_CYLGO|nr:unnamed protein product [Cylicostephanus goldi]
MRTVGEMRSTLRSSLPDMSKPAKIYDLAVLQTTNKKLPEDADSTYFFLFVVVHTGAYIYEINAESAKHLLTTTSRASLGPRRVREAVWNEPYRILQIAGVEAYQFEKKIQIVLAIACCYFCLWKVHANCYVTFVGYMSRHCYNRRHYREASVCELAVFC